MSAVSDDLTVVGFSLFNSMVFGPPGPSLAAPPVATVWGAAALSALISRVFARADGGAQLSRQSFSDIWKGRGNVRRRTSLEIHWRPNGIPFSVRSSWRVSMR